jgi:hypothetical protein
MSDKQSTESAERTRHMEDAFDLLIHTCPLADPVGLNNRELAVSALSAALAAEDADLVDRVAEALRWVGQDWLLRGRSPSSANRTPSEKGVGDDV